MTPHAAQQSELPRAIAVGVIIGLTIVGLEGAAAFALAKRAGKDARRGWNLQPVLCAARELKAGPFAPTDAVTCDVPEQFVTTSVLKPGDATKAAQLPLTSGLLAGEMIRWTDFEVVPRVQVLFASRDLPVGTTIDAGDVVAHTFRAEWLTDGWVRATDRERLLGAKVTVPIARGEPMLWSHLPAAPK
jgi:pilus assembly protein CpaB